MAGKRGQRIQTKRNSRNKYKWEKRVNAQNRVLNKKDRCNFLCKSKVVKSFIEHEKYHKDFYIDSGGAIVFIS